MEAQQVKQKAHQPSSKVSRATLGPVTNLIHDGVPEHTVHIDHIVSLNELKHTHTPRAHVTSPPAAQTPHTPPAIAPTIAPEP